MTYGAAVVFTILAAVLFVLLVGFARPIAVLMQAPEEAVSLTTSYVRICGCGILFIVAYNLLSAVFRGLGDSRSPLLFMLVPSALMQSMASFVAQNIGAGNPRRAKKSMLTGIAVGVPFGCVMFVLVMLKGDVLAGLFSTDAEVVRKGFEYLRGFAPETIVTGVLFSMVGYFNGNNKTLWVMIQGLVQTLLVRLPLAYYMSMQQNASLTKIGLSAPVATVVGILLNIMFYIYLNRKNAEESRVR